MYFFSFFSPETLPSLKMGEHDVYGISIFLKSNTSRPLVRRLKGNACLFGHRKGFEALPKFLGLYSILLLSHNSRTEQVLATL